MKNLIIHPKDYTTDFLSPIYAPLPNKTVIDCGVPKYELRKLIATHDRVIMLGHGSPYGLMSVGQFPEAGFYVVDESMISLLRNKIDGIYIWCNAYQFLQRHDLEGLCSGMFISEVGEAICYGFDDIDGDLIEDSNNCFASIMGKYINEPLPEIYRKLLLEYGLIAKTNPVARFKLERLYFTSAGMKIHPEMMGILEVS